MTIIIHDTEQPSCKTCRFMRGGDCRRNPPVTMLVEYPAGFQWETNFPYVGDDGWCGEYSREDPYEPRNTPRTSRL